MAKRIITPVFRGSYAFIFEPRKPKKPGDKAKYGIAMLFPKADAKALEPLKAAVLQAAVDKYGPKAADLYGKNTLRLKQPFRDGDVERPEDPAMKDVIFANANSDRAPGIVDLSNKPIFEREEAFSGCYFRASVNPFAFEVDGNKGVALGLNNLLLVKKGERLDGRMSAEQEFADLSDDTGRSSGGNGGSGGDDLADVIS